MTHRRLLITEALAVFGAVLGLTAWTYLVFDEHHLQTLEPAQTLECGQ